MTSEKLATLKQEQIDSLLNNFKVQVDFCKEHNLDMRIKFGEEKGETLIILKDSIHIGSFTGDVHYWEKSINDLTLEQIITIKELVEKRLTL